VPPEDATAQEVHPVIGSVAERTRLQFEPELVLEKPGRGSQMISQCAVPLGPERAIVHVPDVSLDPKVFLDEAVEPAQVEVREVLGGQAADRQAAAGCGLEAGDDPAKERKQAAVHEQTLQPGRQNFMRDAREVLARNAQ
jgi:hypothetical protein